MINLSAWRSAAFLAALSALTLLVYSVFRNKTYYDFLTWNLFLAWVPFVFSFIAYETGRRVRSRMGAVIIVVLGACWLLFYPNSPYIVTDLVHLTAMKGLYASDQGTFAFRYWYDLLVVVLFAWNGLLLCVFSLYQVHSLMRLAAGPLLGWVFAAGAALLGGYGVLLGRVYRLNSWDVLTDIHLIRQIAQESLHARGLLFSLLFGFMIGIVYVSFYFAIHQAGRAGQRA
ncbi:DUF1361 domain-containing protein [Paenibacillus sp. UNC499MF]|uniref:DUF1361 domain-containing protein n=1 Tax=Paenibacillus sp. UNC499MF TaxID=1502751 RepID=UPI00089FFF1F|nr:DUF1361 domain-containing protein [Paenibacillus sp. UNC499MF]SEF46763.1 Uncharacterized membrane protein [Paenibacillus sp. UNC499MF]